ncbi:hypothetical protein [Parvularcula maris]|uniref:J domain-containing protein n=1 Tax=Parvularcula maris TaxID=2965077 RepID=A0A9X2RL17_9PROT|nr:hypothetical protein [Parvularcula maris]MCQ8186137.1 hypothetical protein [Parvularcula maris]
MLLFFLAVLLLASGFLAKRLELPSAVRRRLLIIGALTAAAVLLLSWMRLTPLAIVAMLIGAGIAASAVLQARGSLSGFEDLGERPPSRPGPRGMSRAEALSVLGLAEPATAEEITAAHKRMILRAHPDQGGSDYLAAKVNEAKGVLLPKDRA